MCKASGQREPHHVLENSEEGRAAKGQGILGKMVGDKADEEGGGEKARIVCALRRKAVG